MQKKLKKICKKHKKLSLKKKKTCKNANLKRND